MAQEPLSKPVSPEQTAVIARTILSLYYRNGEPMYFMFDDKLLSLKDFLLTLLPSLAEMKWAFDKEEIIRLWNFLYVLHTNITKVGAEFGMHHGTACGRSEEVLLNLAFITAVIGTKEGRHLPDIRNHHLNTETCLQSRPTHELRLTGFKNFWFYVSQTFLKHVPVMRDTCVITLFIASKPIWNGNVRYSITFLPHVHLNPFDVHNKYTDFKGGCITTRAKHVFKTKASNAMRHMEFKALVWNISKALPSTIEKTLYFLITNEHPSLIMLLGAHRGGTYTKLANALGFIETTPNSGADAALNGVSLLWQEDAITVKHLPSYHTTLHIHVTVHLNLQRLCNSISFRLYSIDQHPILNKICKSVQLTLRHFSHSALARSRRRNISTSSRDASAGITL